MAKFETYARPRTRDDAAMRLFRAGVLHRQPGVTLEELVTRAGGYTIVRPLGQVLREQVRQVAQLTNDAKLLALAERGEVSISLEHLRGMDPKTPIILGCRLAYAPGESQQLGLEYDGQIDPTSSVFISRAKPGSAE
jgi:hypothetical protein